GRSGSRGKRGRSGKSNDLAAGDAFLHFDAFHILPNGLGVVLEVALLLVERRCQFDFDGIGERLNPHEWASGAAAASTFATSLGGGGSTSGRSNRAGGVS